MLYSSGLSLKFRPTFLGDVQKGYRKVRLKNYAVELARARDWWSPWACRGGGRWLNPAYPVPICGRYC